MSLIIKNLLIIIFLTPCISTSQNNKIVTKILWAENQFHYAHSFGSDTYYKKGDFVNFININDTIGRENYISGYYEIEKCYRKIQYTCEIENFMQNRDWISNYNIINEALPNFDNYPVKIIKNKVWSYFLCEVTFEECYLGEIEQRIPVFNKKIYNDEDFLDYEVLKIPTYIIKLISIKPYKG